MAASFSDYLEAKILDYVFGAQAFSAPATIYAALFTAAPTDAGGGTEVTGGSYARVAITNNSTNFPNSTGTSPTTKQNGTQITFPTATANWGTCVALGLFDNSSGGNLLAWTPLTGTSYTFTATGSSDEFWAPGSSYSNNDTVWLANTVGGTLPTGVNTATMYYIVNVASDVFELSLTSGGAVINITSDGAGRIQATTPKTIDSGDSAIIAINSITLTLD